MLARACNLEIKDLLSFQCSIHDWAVWDKRQEVLTQRLSFQIVKGLHALHNHDNVKCSEKVW